MDYFDKLALLDQGLELLYLALEPSLVAFDTLVQFALGLH